MNTFLSSEHTLHYFKRLHTLRIHSISMYWFIW